MRYKDPYMNMIMTPPAQEFYPQESEQSSMRMVKGNGLGGVGIGEVVGTGEVGIGSGDTLWGMSVSTVAITAIVISAIAFMALCVVSMSRR